MNMETYEAQQEAGVPHMENPFELKEEKAMDSSSSPSPAGVVGVQQKQSKSKNKKREKSDRKQEITTSASSTESGGRGSIGMEEKDESEEKKNSHTSADQDEDEDEVEGAGELNYMSMTDAIGNTFIEPGQDASAESSFDSERKEDDDKQTDTSAEEEERGRRESAKRIVRQLAAGEERLAGGMDNNTRRMLDEDAVQDALIQAAEDAMRYAYEEASRKQQPSSGSTNSLPNSFEQHQLAEVLVRQKQGLLRLEELEHKLDEMGNRMDKMASMIQQQQQQQQQRPASLGTSGSGPSAPESSEGSTSLTTAESTSMPMDVPKMDTPSNIRGPPSIQTARRLIEQETTLDTKQDYPLSVTLPRRIMFKALQLIDLIKSQSSQLMQQLSTKLLASLEKESWSDVQLTMRSTLREFGARIIAQIRRLRLLITEGRLDTTAGQSPGWRQIYEGFEDRVLATAILSGLATLFLLYRHRQRQNLMKFARENAALAPATLLTNHVQQQAPRPIQQKRVAVPFLVT